MWQLVHSLCGDNNLVPFHLRWREIVLKSEKVCKCFVQDCAFQAYICGNDAKQMNFVTGSDSVQEQHSKNNTWIYAVVEISKF